MYHFCTEKELEKINIAETCDPVAVSDYLGELIKEVRIKDEKDEFVRLSLLDSWRRSKCPNHIYKGYQDPLCTLYETVDLFCIERLAVASAFDEWAKESGFDKRNEERWNRINSRAIREQYEAENRVSMNENFVNVQDKDTRDFYKEIFKRAENAV